MSTTPFDTAKSLAEMADLLRAILAELKTSNARKRGKTAEYVRGDSSRPKPCLVCPLREACQHPCQDFDQWVADTGLDKARPGVPAMKGGRS